MPSNSGVGAALDFGLTKCSGKYIAKADGDDIYSLQRLQLQKEYLDKNPCISVVGSLIEFFTDDEEVLMSERYQNLKTNFKKQVNSIVKKEDIKEKLYWFSCITHSSVMIRSDVYKKVGYDRSLRIGEDYKLFYQLNEMGISMEKIPENFVRCRVSSASITALHVHEMFRSIYKIKRDIIKDIFRKQNVFIWGAGGYGKALLPILREEKLKLSGFIDSNRQLWGEKVAGIPVCSPSILRDNQHNKGIIVASDPGKFAIVNELDKMGYKHLDNYIVF